MAKEKEKNEELEENKEPVVDIFEKGLSDVDMMAMESPAEEPSVEPPPPVVQEESAPAQEQQNEPVQEEITVQQLVGSGSKDQPEAEEPEVVETPPEVEVAAKEEDRPVSERAEAERAKKVEVSPEIAAKSAEELAQDISATVLDAKKVRAEEEDVDKEMKKLKSKKKRLEKQLDEDKKKIAEEAEQARRLVEGE